MWSLNLSAILGKFEGFPLVIPFGFYPNDTVNYPKIWIMGDVQTFLRFSYEPLFGLGSPANGISSVIVHTISHFPSGSNFSGVRIV
jgi:hypothetical protein